MDLIEGIKTVPYPLQQWLNEEKVLWEMDLIEGIKTSSLARALALSALVLWEMDLIEGIKTLAECNPPAQDVLLVMRNGPDRRD